MLGIDKKKAGFDDLVKLVNEQKSIRYVAYAAGALVVLYVLGKSMSIVAGTVRSFNELKNAIKT